MRTAAMDLAALSMFDTAASSPVDGDGQSRVCALAVAMDLAAECRLESSSVLFGSRGRECSFFLLALRLVVLPPLGLGDHPGC